ncbi:hypothetical protein [Amylibacter sp. SFDW26]|nr:hypothetical protein [Amylibacter sp. SFDW26]
MTNKTAIAFGIFLLALIAHDVVVNGSENIVFLAQKGIELMDWIAFWR